MNLVLLTGNLKFWIYCVILALRNELTVLKQNELMTDHRKISQTLEKLLSSKTFSKPGVYRTCWMRWIAQQGGNSQRTTDRFRRFLGKKPSLTKSSTFRVYILNLRNKLKEYYQNRERRYRDSGNSEGKIPGWILKFLIQIIPEITREVQLCAVYIRIGADHFNHHFIAGRKVPWSQSSHLERIFKAGHPV